MTPGRTIAFIPMTTPLPIVVRSSADPFPIRCCAASCDRIFEPLVITARSPMTTVPRRVSIQRPSYEHSIADPDAHAAQVTDPGPVQRLADEMPDRPQHPTPTTSIAAQAFDPSAIPLGSDARHRRRNVHRDPRRFQKNPAAR